MMAGRIREVLATKVSFISLITGIGIFASLLTSIGYLGGYFWIFDLCSHFRPQYALVIVFSAILLALLKRYWTATIISIFIIPNLFEIIPLYLQPSVPEADGNPILRLMFANVHTANKNYVALISAVKKEAPDILILEEVDQEWMRNLEELAKEFEYKISFPQSDNFGIALFSRISPENCEIKMWGEFKLPYVEAVFGIRGKTVKFWAVHALPPVNGEYSRTRNMELAYFSKVLKDENGIRILAGDLNITPWSLHFKKFLKESGMRNSMKGFGIQPTWPTINPLMLIPIDHCLISPDVSVSGRRVGDVIGSDHRPLIIDLLF